MDITELKRLVADGNKELPKLNLVKFSWGNVSAIDRSHGIIVIKPVGMPYDELTADNICVTDLNGQQLEGTDPPSVDLDIHRALYEHFPACGAIVHTHSIYATIMAQLHRSLPCFGTTHADYFATDIPCTDPLTPTEIETDYEWNTGMAIVRCFEQHGISPKDTPAVFSIDHGPFTWGENVWDAVHKAAVLEELCKMAVHMLAISPDVAPIPVEMSNKHFYRKHGPNAYFTNDDYGHGRIKRG